MHDGTLKKGKNLCINYISFWKSVKFNINVKYNHKFKSTVLFNAVNMNIVPKQTAFVTFKSRGRLLFIVSARKSPTECKKIINCLKIS